MREAFGAGGVGVVEDLLAAGLDRPGGAVVYGCRGVQPDPGMAVLVTPLSDLGRSCSLIFLTGGGG